VTVRLLLAALLVGLVPSSASAVGRTGSAVMLLRDGRVVRVGIPDGAGLAERRLGATASPSQEGGHLIAVRGRELFVLVPGRPAVLASLAGDSLRMRWRRTLEAGVSYRAVVLAGSRLYAVGYRPGRIVDKELRYREAAAVITVIGTDGTRVRSSAIRPAQGHDWWEWWASASPDGRRLAVAWHGGCGPNSAPLCTTGADLLDVTRNGAQRCTAHGTRSNAGCIPDVHGMIEPLRGGWIATTGEEPLLVLDERGRVVRRLHSGFHSEHLMSFVVDAAHDRVLVLSVCYLGREGLRSVSLRDGMSRLVRHSACGSDPVLGPGTTVLAVAAPKTYPAPVLVAFDASSGRTVLRRRFRTGILAVARG